MAGVALRSSGSHRGQEAVRTATSVSPWPRRGASGPRAGATASFVGVRTDDR